MIYDIENKKVNAIVKNEKVELPEELKLKIKMNFENIKKSGANVWNGEVLCVTECNVLGDILELACKKSDFAHYLYGERIGCPNEYICRNLSAGCLMETKDNCYLIAEQGYNTSYPMILTVTGGNVDKKDIEKDDINVMATIIRETLEELNIDLEDKSKILYNKLKYVYVSEKDEQPGVTVFSKAKINMTAEELKKHFEEYYDYLQKNNLELEFGRIYFFKKENILKDLNEMKNLKRDWLVPLITADIDNI